MDVWHMALYGIASFLALRSLISLMTHHKHAFRRHILRQAHGAVQQRAAENVSAASADDTAA